MARQLIEAIRNGNQALARTILHTERYGCIDCQTAKRDGTALFWACAKGFVELVQLLIAKGANVNARTNYNATPLIAAADNNRHHVVRLLIEHGADLNAQTSNGDTACHQAAYRGHVEAVRLLVSNGADVDIANTKFRTPYDEAARQGHLSLLPFLDGSEKLGQGRESRSLAGRPSIVVSKTQQGVGGGGPTQGVCGGSSLARMGDFPRREPPRRDSCDCLSHESLSRESSYEDCGQAAVIFNTFDLDGQLRERELLFGPDPERFFPPSSSSSSSSFAYPSLPPSSGISFPTAATGRPSRDVSLTSGLTFTYNDAETNNLSLTSDRSSSKNLISRLNIPA
ncbi:hypothetical protein ACOMHN_015052 [Nucella lapillus]